MGFADIDDEEGNALTIFLIKLVEGGNLPPEGWSSVTAEDEHHRLQLG